MTLTLGAHHSCSVPTLFTTSQPVGLVLTLGSIPNYIPRDVGTPVEYHRIGRINLGNALGYKFHIPLTNTPQLIYPLEPEYTLLQVNQHAGITVGIDEIASSTSLMPKPQYFDRNPTSIQVNQFSVVSGAAAETVMWTYTVPTGRKLMLAHYEVRVVRAATSTAFGNMQAYGYVNTVQMLNAIDVENVVGRIVTDSLNAGALLLQAGEYVRASYFSGDTGGTHYVRVMALGTEFDS